MAEAPDAHLFSHDEELDAALELFFLAETALWASADETLKHHEAGLGRSHFRILFLLRRRPGLGVRDLAVLTGTAKQAASRILADLQLLGFAAMGMEERDGRRRPMRLTDEGAALESQVSDRLRARLDQAARAGGRKALEGTRRFLTALAGEADARP